MLISPSAVFSNSATLHSPGRCERGPKCPFSKPFLPSDSFVASHPLPSGHLVSVSPIWPLIAAFLVILLLCCGMGMLLISRRARTSESSESDLGNRSDGDFHLSSSPVSLRTGLQPRIPEFAREDAFGGVPDRREESGSANGFDKSPAVDFAQCGSEISYEDTSDLAEWIASRNCLDGGE